MRHRCCTKGSEKLLFAHCRVRLFQDFVVSPIKREKKNPCSPLHYTGPCDVWTKREVTRDFPLCLLSLSIDPRSDFLFLYTICSYYRGMWTKFTVVSDVTRGSFSLDQFKSCWRFQVCSLRLIHLLRKRLALAVTCSFKLILVHLYLNILHIICLYIYSILACMHIYMSDWMLWFFTVPRTTTPPMLKLLQQWATSWSNFVLWIHVVIYLWLWPFQEEPSWWPTEGPGHHAAPGGGRGAGGLRHVLHGWADLQGHVPGVSLHWHPEQRQRHALVSLHLRECVRACVIPFSLYVKSTDAKTNVFHRVPAHV